MQPAFFMQTMIISSTTQRAGRRCDRSMGTKPGSPLAAEPVVAPRGQELGLVLACSPLSLSSPSFWERLPKGSHSTKALIAPNRCLALGFVCCLGGLELWHSTYATSWGQAWVRPAPYIHPCPGQHLFPALLSLHVHLQSQRQLGCVKSFLGDQLLTLCVTRWLIEDVLPGPVTQISSERKIILRCQQHRAPDRPGENKLRGILLR